MLYTFEPYVRRKGKKQNNLTKEKMVCQNLKGLWKISDWFLWWLLKVKSVGKRNETSFGCEEGTTK